MSEQVKAFWELTPHKAWWLDNTDSGRLYKQLHTYLHGHHAQERSFFLNGSCPICGHSAPGIYKPDLLESPYHYECQRKYNPHGLMKGFRETPCYYECDVCLNDDGVKDVYHLMQLKVEKIKLILRISEIDQELKPFSPTFNEDNLQYQLCKY